ncbi:MAG: hypothetical protein HRU23_02750 [Gammaproteobacteria bacterium]|nr:hypothetical protein [Gammaproteobacteria bacterium]
MHKTKECIMCFSEIDARAQKCPKCTSLQAKFSNLENSPILLGIAGLLMIAIFGFILYKHFYVSTLEQQAIEDLKLTVTDVSTKVETEGLFVACIGNIKNETEFKFKELKYQVDFIAQNNELVDTFSVTDEDIKVLAHASTHFRVRGIGQKEAGDYKRCVVTITDAWAY